MKINNQQKKHESLSNISTKTLKAELEQRAEKREITKEIIKIIATTSAITLGALVAPQATATICKMIYDSGSRQKYNRDKAQIKQTINRLKNQKIISFEKNNHGEIVIKLSQNGKKRLLRYRLEDIRLPQPSEWDGLWRIVMFDVPEDKRAGRDMLRAMIKRLGMHELQHSVWVYPHHCKDEIDFVGAYYGIGKHILYIETEKLENESHYLELFRLHR